MLEHARRGGRAEVSFVLPQDQPSGLVSVVGDFNGWDPAAHILTPRNDGMRAVKIAMPIGCSFAFRYRGADGALFIEQGTDRFDEQDSYVET